MREPSVSWKPDHRPLTQTHTHTLFWLLFIIKHTLSCVDRNDDVDDHSRPSASLWVPLHSKELVFGLLVWSVMIRRYSAVTTPIIRTHFIGQGINQLAIDGRLERTTNIATVPLYLRKIVNSLLLKKLGKL